MKSNAFDWEIHNFLIYIKAWPLSYPSNLIVSLLFAGIKRVYMNYTPRLGWKIVEDEDDCSFLWDFLLSVKEFSIFFSYYILTPIF